MINNINGLDRRFCFLLIFLYLIGCEFEFNLTSFIKSFLFSSFFPVITDRKALAVMALSVSVTSVFFSFLIFKRSTEKSVEDDYWLRSVLLPGYLKVLIKFVEELPEKVKGCDNDIEKLFDSGWLIEQQDILSRKAQMIRTHSDTIYDEITYFMGVFEDRLGEISETDSDYKDIEVEALGLKFFKSVMESVKKEQFSNSRLVKFSKKRIKL